MLSSRHDDKKFVIPEEWRTSQYFLGNRYLKEDKYERFVEKKNDIEYLKKQFKNIFDAYIEKLEYEDREIPILFLDFIVQMFLFALSQDFNFKKTTTLIEICYNVYSESFNKRLSSEKSLNLLKQILVRHSLFRPPVSILVFDLDEIKKINNFMLHNFYRHYEMYLFANTPFVNLEIRTFDMFKSKFPYTDFLSDGQVIPRTEIPMLQEYLIDKETGLTPEQLEEIMKGDSIHMVPPKKREEWMRLKRERERQQKIDKAIQKETERLNKEMEEKMKVQDDAFIEAVQNIKNPKKK
ncbi:hypothetical protein TTHERM_00785860 (macronuclear) [Tetrahymena thermophila SB210]|uniref:Uncharacterized protein n=1 Tax=Tetrahymena thermophila (strain SB210) TaxID=312017 RepID=Q23ZH8_TETTS|nr:hypothetical protein TTHERM_00785860 [Tetrahymena thermophila SB210]EAS01879.1 hypothetical protein TTHERM_00785860 [Tetrahymena thermophila SB210]|eukprot:XP_001022124.1 hypothetical protein TTHERM_00785860 [Tetrahymena thermophila SB210]